MTAVSTGTATCPNCGADRIAGATFCEACAFEFTDTAPGTDAEPVAVGPPDGGVPPAQSFSGAAAAEAAATPVTAPRGEESPLDVGWTGAISSDTTTETEATGPEVAAGDGAPCRQCSDGHYLDGYCDTCGAKQPDPRDHYTEEPAPWVAGVCDIGKRHRRNEDGMALAAEAASGSFAALVVCDGVSNSTDSHIASLAASRAARDVLQKPLPQGVGTTSSIVAAAVRRLAEAVAAAGDAVEVTTRDAGEAAADSPPSCTFVAALVAGGTAVVGNVGDSRAYWLPDAPSSPPRQLSEDDSFAAAQMSAGMPRKEAESSAGAHAITQWLGVDAPDDLTPHTRQVDLAEDGWLLLCSDGLWNYSSDATDLQRLVHETVARLGAAGRHPLTLAQALTDFANESGGVDNITVALARVGPLSEAGPKTPGPPAPETKDTP
ncbi:MAG: PP2C family serine/threonine-protein phosphatase [Lapillicoccus sp.]